MEQKVTRLVDLGTREYMEAYKIQRDLVQHRSEGLLQDTLIFVEHPPVITMGRSGGGEHLLVGRDFLVGKGIFVCEINRGGDITYHGPGQLVGYPILQLAGSGRDLHQLARKYEEVIILSLAEFGLTGTRISGCTGVWIDGLKVAAIGVGVKSWVTFHGFALNVKVDLTPFSYIIPCGIRDKGVTSMEALLGQEVDMAEVKRRVAGAFARVFETEVRDGEVEGT